MRPPNYNLLCTSALYNQHIFFRTFRAVEHVFDFSFLWHLIIWYFHFNPIFFHYYYVFSTIIMCSQGFCIQFNAIHLRYSSDLQKCKYHLRTTISWFLGIFWKSGMLFLGLLKIKFLSKTLGPLNPMPSVSDTYRTSKNARDGIKVEGLGALRKFYNKARRKVEERGRQMRRDPTLRLGTSP